MRSGLRGIAARQHGIFARHQALTYAYTSREFAAMTAPGGQWVKVRYGVYAEREFWQSLDDHQRLLLKDRAAALVCAPDAVLTHSSAARLLGLPLHDVVDGLSHVTRPLPCQSGRVQAQVKHHRATLDPAQVIVVSELKTTVAERTVLDLSREYGYRTGLVAADAALHGGASSETLAALASALTTEPRAPVMTAVVAEADGRAQTPIETLSRVLLTDMGIDDLELQHVIHFPGGGHAEGDLYSPSLNHLFECDGRVKYQDQYDARGRLVTADEVVWLEKKREDKIRGLGIGVSRILWSDTSPANFERTCQRLWREIEQQSSHRLWLPPSA
ncbi:MAG: hypothetical protein ABJA81_13390 [Nocardioidaceae bacterium]